MTANGIGCIPDVALGYGTPQIQYLMQSLGRHYGPRSPVFICEPDSPLYPEAHAFFPDLSFCRIYPSVRPARNPWWYLDSGAGEREFADGVRAWLNSRRPRILVVTGRSSRFLRPELLRDCGSPFVIDYVLEFVPKGEMTPAAAALHQAGVNEADLLVHCERVRQLLHTREFGTQATRQIMLRNVPPIDLFPRRAAGDRNGRVLMSSVSIAWGRTFPEYVLNPRRPRIPVDVYGNAFGDAARVLSSRDLGQAFDVRFLGAVPIAELTRARASYSYSFVAWNPTSPSSLYVSPCKFYESIASAVPPIVAPHPECAEVIRRYDCGLLMRDWSFDAFCDALEEARRIHGTARYRELVRNCVEAHRADLHWEAQFAQLAPLLPEEPSTSRGRRSRRFLLVDSALAETASPGWRDAVALLEEAKNAGLSSMALVSRRLGSRLPEGVLARPVLWEADGGRGERAAASACERSFDWLRRLLKSEAIGRGDHVWLADQTPFRGRVLQWLASDERVGEQVWHLPLPAYGSVNGSIGVLAQAVQRRGAGHMLHLHAASASESRKWARRLGVDVSVSPSAKAVARGLGVRNGRS